MSFLKLIASFLLKVSPLTTTFSFSFRISGKLTSLLEFPLFCEIFTSAVVLSLCAFEVVNVESFFSVEFAARAQFTQYALIELFIFCRAAENIKHESEKVGERIYMSRWCHEEISKRRIRPLLLFSMLRASRSVRTSALGLSVVSFETFLGVSETLSNQISLQTYFADRPIQLFAPDASNSNTATLKCFERDKPNLKSLVGFQLNTASAFILKFNLLFTSIDFMVRNRRRKVLNRIVPLVQIS